MGTHTTADVQTLCQAAVFTTFRKPTIKYVVGDLIRAHTKFRDMTIPLSQMLLRFIFTTCMAMLRRHGISVNESSYIRNILYNTEAGTMLGLLFRREGMVDAKSGNLYPLTEKQCRALDKCISALRELKESC